MINGVMIQFFEYDLKYEDHLWRFLKYEASFLSDLGITAVWMPPAFKGCMGRKDTGYGVYDLYDLGEFDQKWTIPTKYGYKVEYLDAINKLHSYGIHCYADIVMNHRMGSDDVNVVEGIPVKQNDRTQTIGKKRLLSVGTQYNYPHRNNTYSAFKWTADHFNGVDYDFKTRKKGIYLINNKQWSNHVSKENGNFDYLMGANVDVNQKDVKAELLRFGHWYNETTHVDGYRMDALKHIDSMFIKEWLKEMRTEKDYFAVGEYWSGIVEELEAYLKETDYSIHLFDVPLHYRFYEACKNKDTYDLRNLFKDTLVERNHGMAVTFVDNHDTQPKQALNSFIEKWFKPFAYACILLRKDGYPCVFYGDLYGLKYTKYQGIPKELSTLILLRKQYATGWQTDYITQGQFGFTREGGLAVLFSLRQDGQERMYVGKQYAHKTFKDMFHRQFVTIDEEGFGYFTTKANTLSVFIEKKS